MSRTTQNAKKLFMHLQDVRSFFDPAELPQGCEQGLDQLITNTKEIINTREEMGI